MRQPSTRREKEIWQVCDALWAEFGDFKFLTGDVIAEQLLELGYKKGSPNERYKYRSTWKETRGVKTELEQVSQPATFSDPIQRAVFSVQQGLQAEAQAEFKPQLELLKNQLEAEQQQLQQARQYLSKIENEALQLREELSPLKTAYRDLEQQHSQTVQQQALAWERERGAEKLLEENRRSHELQIEDLKQAHQRTIDLFQKQFNEALARQQAEMQQLKEILESQRHRLINENDALKTEIHKLQRWLMNYKSSSCNLKTERNNEMNCSKIFVTTKSK
jgi:chromosome segregation ATPase